MKETWKWIVLGAALFLLAFLVALPFFMGGSWGMMGPGMMGGFGWWGAWMMLPMVFGGFIVVGLIVLLLVAVLRLGSGFSAPKMARTCPSCGRSVRDDWNTCPYCGSKLS